MSAYWSSRSLVRMSWSRRMDIISTPKLARLDRHPGYRDVRCRSLDRRLTVMLSLLVARTTRRLNKRRLAAKRRRWRHLGMTCIRMRVYGGVNVVKALSKKHGAICATPPGTRSIRTEFRVHAPRPGRQFANSFTSLGGIERAHPTKPPISSSRHRRVRSDRAMASRGSGNTRGFNLVTT